MMDLVHTPNQAINLPAIEITKMIEGHNYVPLAGHGAILAVFDTESKCIGWMDSMTLGYDTVSKWMEASKWEDKGF